MFEFNPSSLATNKTLLQAIEELKSYLKAHPSYKLYMSSDNYTDGTYVYDKSNVGGGDSIAPYDVVFFQNSYYSVVESVGDSAITCYPAISFEGPQGSTGPQGVSVSGASINASGHLIITLSDGSTIDAGYLPANYDNTITLTSASGTLTNDQYNKLLNDDSHIKYGDKIYSKVYETATYINFEFLETPNGTTNIYRIQITKSTKGYVASDKHIVISPDSNIISTGATAGQVIVADGSDGCDWGSIPAPEGSDIKSTGESSGKVLTADGSNGASWSSVPATEGTAVLSTGETSGKVLTADGSGGASWQTASGGTTLNYYNYGNLYGDISKIHNILRNSKGYVDGFIIITVNAKSYRIPVSCIYTSSATQGGVRAISLSTTGPTLLFFTADINNGSWSNIYAYEMDTTTGTLSQRFTSAPVGSVDIRYYNDTQLH